MNTWNVVTSIATVLAGAALAALAAGCAWPVNGPRRPPKRTPGQAYCPLRPVLWPTTWTCHAPDHPFTLADAHDWMQQHRNHDCARKRAAFAALVAAGRIHPDSSRRQRLRRTDD